MEELEKNNRENQWDFEKIRYEKKKQPSSTSGMHVLEPYWQRSLILLK